MSRRSRFQVRSSLWHGYHFVSSHKSPEMAKKRSRAMNEAVNKVVKCNCNGDCFEVYDSHVAAGKKEQSS